MHELAVCQALIAQVEQIARREHARRVLSVRVQVGPLSGVEAPLLKRAFPLAAAGTVAATAELRLETLPVRVSCGACGATCEARPNRLTCGRCGDWRTRVVAGDELCLRGVELVARQPRPRAEPMETREHV